MYNTSARRLVLALAMAVMMLVASMSVAFAATPETYGEKNQAHQIKITLSCIMETENVAGVKWRKLQTKNGESCSAFL